MVTVGCKCSYRLRGGLLHTLRGAIIFALLWVSTTALGDGAVWRVSSASGVLYIGGTLHLLSEEDYPLPDAYDRAYAEADSLVLEADLKLIESPEFQQLLASRMLYPPGEALAMHLSPEVYRQLEEYCRSRGYPMAMIQNFRPGMVSVTLSVLEMQRLGMAGTGVDQHFYQRALADRKPIDVLESVEEQLAAIASMGEGEEDEMILNTLNDLQMLPTALNSVKQAWREGDLLRLDEEVMQPMQRDYPRIYRQLLVDRNSAWLEKLERLLASPQPELVLVGALHLVGEAGVLQRLSNLGYRVERW
ncbi:TraB/GumN family protein [Aestuariirhabdus litorea]|uniref:TraB/GumN family protein n=1 Tax=Aestuariirhabdus litorea TaxID=2528527 RepID=A0A3P3VTK0_9GAMM|nr:TraB/GumN family protein [Aestuariirhabdus litorea]RRJ84083.1 TraB/GumN family protein [Aestuariirhabdus litorea]RWW97303.1 TraB/GumN family protein [Endozoicomonadaceae bacterium GTF-13]